MRHRQIRKQRYLLGYWRRRQARQQEALVEAQHQQAVEQRAARARVLDMATTVLPTIPAAPRETPLLTRGQAWRGGW